ncbi:hypothetical protein EROM_071460 [Encephalitozoon romaleae SJ-2008]|uniref:Uncharacterized protein n=1 Tax=Encephalitozoon romaleae (strain SJ-2008) TaxID=1178016 RepID=I7ASI6_ENCRO|nr:hypothetical protein EROM_071460 [Encephalitozoon romaleae SJ-2008]AFN83397.1 hypothetical protein EROM_071460 [Encephalitozoon romaleae SJ-2008]
MILALLLLGHVVRADIFDNISLEKVLGEGLKSDNGEQPGANNASLSQAPKEEKMSSTLAGASLSSSYSIPSQASISSISTVASGKKNGEETPIIIITQENSKDKGGKEQEERIASIVRNAISGNKTKSGLTMKSETVEENEGSTNNGEFREGQDKEVKSKPNTINNSLSPIMAKAVGNSSNLEDSYWTTIIVDNKLRKVKVNVKVMTVVESIDDAIKCSSKEGDAKEKEKKFNFWSKSEEKSKGGDIPTTVSVPSSKEKDSRKTTSQSIKTSAKDRSSDAKEKRTVEVSKPIEPELASSSISPGKGIESKKESESASKSIRPSVSSMSEGSGTSKKSGKDESTSSKHSKFVGSTKSSSGVSTKGKGTESKSVETATKEKSKKQESMTTSLSSRASQGLSTVASVISPKNKKKTSSSKEGTSTTSTSKMPTSIISHGSKKSKGTSKDTKDITTSKSEKEGKSGSEKKEANPEMNELFYVLKNMPGKASISDPEGKMFVEGNFVALKEEKLKDKKFKFSGYIQAAHT